MTRFDKKENVKITCKRPFHRVAVAYGCSRNTAKKYIGWAVAFGKYQKIYNSWICFEDYRDFRTWKRQQKLEKGLAA